MSQYRIRIESKRKIGDLTRLDFFAGLALHGLLSGSPTLLSGGTKEVAKQAVDLGADMIEALYEHHKMNK